MRLAYFHTNRLLIEFYQQEMEIRCKKDDGPIKMATDIDHHGPVPYSISSQTPDPPHFSLPTTFKVKTMLPHPFPSANLGKMVIRAMLWPSVLFVRY